MNKYTSLSYRLYYKYTYIHMFAFVYREKKVEGMGLTMNSVFSFEMNFKILGRGIHAK